MKASETKLIRIIEGTNQYLVPHFQRPYTWQRKHWDTLWSDLELVLPLQQESGVHSPEHFMGAIVTAPAHSVPEGVTKYLVIDGQQRLTTLLILLAAVRDRATQIQDDKLAARIQEMYLTNRYQEGLDQYKLLPTQGDEPKHNDRTSFIGLLDRAPQVGAESLIVLAHQHFLRLMRQFNTDRLSALTNTILSRVFLVSIVLEKDDNPYAIFESLNAKGQPLSQSDLVRNFFFMSISSDKHDEVYYRKWTPMEKQIGRENMESYIRHFLIKEGTSVKESEVYYTLKRRIEDQGREKAESVLDELVRFAGHYVKFLDPEKESVTDVRERLRRILRIRATVAYPFLLNLFEEASAGRVNQSDLIAILDVIENFIIRRYICGNIRAELNELFTALFRSAQKWPKVISRGTLSAGQLVGLVSSRARSGAADP